MNDPQRKLYDAAMEFFKETVGPLLENQIGHNPLAGFTGEAKATPANDTAQERYETAKIAYGEAKLHDVGSPMYGNKMLESIASSLLILVERGLR